MNYHEIIKEVQRRGFALVEYNTRTHGSKGESIISNDIIHISQWKQTVSISFSDESNSRYRLYFTPDFACYISDVLSTMADHCEDYILFVSDNVKGKE